MDNKGMIAVGSIVEVRLALLPGMSEKDPTDEQLTQLRQARGDPALQAKLFGDWRQEPDSTTLTNSQLADRLFLYPRRREARITYVDVNAGQINAVNLEVKTVGSTVLQQAVGHYPNWALETFRLENVAIFEQEPDGAHDIHVAYPTPIADADAPPRDRAPKHAPGTSAARSRATEARRAANASPNDAGLKAAADEAERLADQADREAARK